MFSSRELKNIDDATEMENEKKLNAPLINTKKIIVAFGALVVASVVVAYSLAYGNNPNIESPAVPSVPITPIDPTVPIDPNVHIDPAVPIVPAIFQDTAVKKSNLIFFIAKKFLYSIDPNDEAINAQEVFRFKFKIEINESDPILYDAENVYFQNKSDGNYIYKVQISDCTSNIRLQTTELALGFALDSSKGIYFNQTSNLNTLQYLKFETGQSENIFFPHKCELDSHPRIILISNDGSKLFYMCMSKSVLEKTSVFIHNLRNSDIEGLQMFELFNDERFILSPDDKYAIIFSDDGILCILDVKRNIENIKNFNLHLKSTLKRRIFFSNNGNYLFILDKFKDLNVVYRLIKIDFFNLSKALEPDSVTSISDEESLKYILNTREFIMP